MANRLNKVIKILIFSDLLLWSAMGFLTPVLTILITERIKGGTVKTAGFAWAVYWITKSIFQPPIGMLLDKKKGDKDDFYCLISGSILIAIIPFVYVFASLPWHIYLLQFLMAIGVALSIPPWAALFTKRIDKGKEAFEWGMDNAAVGLGAGITAGVGSMLIDKFGFYFVFKIVGAVALIGALILVPLYKIIITQPKNKRTSLKDKKPFS